MSHKCGDVVMKCKPFVHTLNVSQKSIRCDFCFKINDSLKKCAKCQQMYYCDKNCQKLDWIEGHKNECRIMKNCGQNLDNDWDLFFLRKWLMYKNTDRKSETYDLYNGEKRSFNDLMTHSDDIRNDKKRNLFFTLILSKFKLCHIDFDYEELFELFCKYCINNFSIVTDELHDIGTALYVDGSVFNHSCAPNAGRVFNGIDMEVRAIKPINSGEEVFIDYIDVMSDRNERRAKLREQYYFDCNCIKCITHSDSNVDYNLAQSYLKEFSNLRVQEEWHKCYSIGIKIIPIYHQIYGDFHPNLTLQFYRLLALTVVINQTSNARQKQDKNKMLELFEKTKKAIKITHGLQHPIYNVFQRAVFDLNI